MCEIQVALQSHSICRDDALIQYMCGKEKKCPHTSDLTAWLAMLGKGLLKTGCAVQERWIDPDCEYARPIDPSSSYVPTGSADIYAASKPAKAMNGLGPSVRVSCTQEGMDGPDPSSPFTYKGERVSLMEAHGHTYILHMASSSPKLCIRTLQPCSFVANGFHRCL